MYEERWEYWIDRIDTMQQLSSIDREKAKYALKKIKKFFGKDLSDIAKSDHPIWWNYIHNDIPWTRKWFSLFIDAIEDALKQKNGRSIVDKLRNKDKFDSILFELDIANRFTNSGFQIEFYEKVIDTGKEPDFKIINPETNEEFYVEVSELTASVQSKEATETHQKVSHILFQNLSKNGKRELICACEIYKHYSEKHFQEIKSRILQCIDKCRKTGFEELVEDGIKLALAKEENRTVLNQWCQDQNVHSLLSGPPYNVDEIYRMGAKIEKEQKQLPQNHLNLIVIRDTTLFLFSNQKIEETISRLAEYVYKYDHLAFCVIISTYFDGVEEKIITKGENLFLHKFVDIRSRDIIFLTNKFITSKKITPNSTAKIKYAFTEVKNFVY